MTTAFVLGGGGLLGAHEVGMLRALAEAGVKPDLVVGTSIGALNGVLVAADPEGAADRLSRMWQGEELRLAFSEKLWAGRSGWCVRAPICTRSNRCVACWPGRSPVPISPTSSCRSSAWRPASRTPARAGSAAGRWCPRSWPRAPCPGCCRRSRSTAATTSTAAWSTRSRSGGRSCSAPARSTCCRWAGSKARSRCRAGRGRWAWWRSRSPAGTGSTRRCRRCRRMFGCMCCRPAETGSRRD